jgi:hypothetical protein
MYSLDIPAMCLDNKGKCDLDKITWNKCKFLGGCLDESRVTFRDVDIFSTHVSLYIC